MRVSPRSPAFLKRKAGKPMNVQKHFIREEVNFHAAG